jgi:5-formyltetrahydrofolate cyclo-ligase
MRQQRRNLPARERERAAARLARQLLGSGPFRRARRIACFLSADGEIDTAPLIRAAWRLGKQVYLPVLVPYGPKRLWFRPYRQSTPLVPNRYGIPEPRGGRRLDGRKLDLVLTPLVAFDDRGHRLGMGGGYYDRTFAHLHRLRWQRPRLLGLAFAFQRMAALPAEPWDVPLWGVVTDRGLHRFQQRNNGGCA